MERNVNNDKRLKPLSHNDLHYGGAIGWKSRPWTKITPVIIKYPRVILRLQRVILRRKPYPAGILIRMARLRLANDSSKNLIKILYVILSPPLVILSEAKNLRNDSSKNLIKILYVILSPLHVILSAAKNLQKESKLL